MTKKLYAQRDIESLGHLYVEHVDAMTGEDLYSKSAIAAELAHRDSTIAQLQQDLEAAYAEVARLRRQVEGL